MKCALLLLLALLAGCGASSNNTTANRTVDPAIASALADPLMADPYLERRSNAGALRPADQPYQAMVPPGAPDSLRLGARPTTLARMQPRMRTGFAGCNLNVSYSFRWASRLPPEIELPKDARVAEAAGSDVTGCGLRLVAFALPARPDSVIDLYRRAAKAGSYTIVEEEHDGASVLSARRARDGAAFHLSAFPSAGGSAVDLVSNRGR